MQHLTYDAGVCVMTKIFHLIGGKWKPVILYLIQQDVNRFGMLMKSMPKISKKVLTEQLRELESDNLITRHVLAATAPQVVVYSLTEKGRLLRKLIDSMTQWGIVYFKYFKEEYSDEQIELFLRQPHASFP
jgi:DNA-binding HxlR family transcriptional regulator